MVLGGCPGQQVGLPGDEPSEWEVVVDAQGNIEGPGDQEAGSAGCPQALDQSVLAPAECATAIRLVGQACSGKRLTFSVVAPPAYGELGEIEQVDDTTAELVYSAPADFWGQAQFSYECYEGSLTSNVATVVIYVYPELCFELDAYEGPSPLTVCGRAFTLSGAPLPEGDYAWDFGGVVEAGPVGTHAERNHTFTQGGLHAVTLAVTLAGFPGPVGCAHRPERAGDGDYGDLTRAKVSVGPVISGQLLDAEGRGLAGIQVMSTDGVFAAVSDGSGFYSVSVPYGWSGSIRAVNEGRNFVPESRSFTRLDEDRTGQDFTDESSGAPVSISGRVCNAQGAGLPGVRLSFDPRYADVCTDADGDYELQVPRGWTGNVTPALGAYKFIPPSRHYMELACDCSGENYAGSGNEPPVADAGPDQRLVDGDQDGAEDVTLDGSASYDPDGTIVTYRWTEGAEPLAEGGGSTANVTLGVGVHDITLTVTDDAEAIGTDTLLVTVTTLPGALEVAPSSGLSSSGDEGGPFSPAGQLYTLENTGGQSLDWSVSKTQSWVSLSKTSGTLAAGATDTVVVSINSNADALSAGSYADTVSFTNVTDGAGDTTRAVFLTVVASAGPLQVPYADQSITVDGVCDAGEWSDANTYSFNATDIVPPGVVVQGALADPSDTSATAYLKHDADYLYLAFVVTDDTVIQTGPNVWQADVVELFLDHDNSDTPGVGFNRMQFLVNAGGQTSQGGSNPPDSWTGAGALTASGYSVEFRIAKAEYGLTSGLYGFDIAISDVEPAAEIIETRYWYFATAAAEQDESLWGDIFLEAGPGALSVTPAGGFNSAGPEGGPFDPSSMTYTLTNNGGQSLDWSVSKTQSWVSLTQTSGTLAPGATDTVVVSINSNAEGFSPGSYADTVSFTNVTDGTGSTTRGVSLSVASSDVNAAIYTSPNPTMFAPCTVLFSGVDSAASGDQIVGWYWDFGDTGSSDERHDEGIVAAHCFEVPGAYTVALTAVTASGATDTVTAQVEIVPRPQTTYYVDATNGSDGYNGSAAEYTGGVNGPFQTLTRAFSVSTSQGNPPVILLKRGESWSSSVALNPPRPSIVSAYGTGADPIIELAGDACLRWTGGGGADASQWGYAVTLEGLHLRAPTAWGAETLVWIALKGSVIRRCHLENGGITATGQGQGLVLEDTTIHHARRQGIYSGNDSELGDIVVRRNAIYNCGTNAVLDHGIYMQGAGSYSSVVGRPTSRHYLAENNVLYNNACNDLMVRLFDGVLIRNNDMYGDGNAAYFGGQQGGANGAALTHLWRCVFESNRIHDLTGLHGRGVSATCCGDWLIFRNNLVVNTRKGIKFWDGWISAQGGGDTFMYNNVFSVSSSGTESAFAIEGQYLLPGYSARVTNNIIMSEASLSGCLIYNQGTQPWEFDYNCYYAPNNSFSAFDGVSWSAWRSAGNDGSGMHTSPDLDAGFRPNADSPCRDAGLALPQVFTDFDGNPRDASPNIGAFE